MDKGLTFKYPIHFPGDDTYVPRYSMARKPIGLGFCLKVEKTSLINLVLRVSLIFILNQVSDLQVEIQI